MSDDEFVPTKKKASPKKATKKEPAAKKAPAPKKETAIKKVQTAKKNDVINLINDSPVAKPPLAKRATAQKKPVIDISDDMNSDDDLSNDDYIPLTKPEKKPRAAASKPKRKYNSSSDSDDLFKSPSTSSRLTY